MNKLSFGEWANELVLLFKVRQNMSGDQARRFVLDCLDFFKEEFDEGCSPQESYEREVNTWTDNV